MPSDLPGDPIDFDIPEPTPATWKRFQERTIFERFCESANIRLAHNSIEQPQPPAPDVIAELVGVGRVAFELVRLNHPDHLTRLSLMHKTPSFLNAAFDALPLAQHEKLRHLYADGVITIGFRGAVDLSKRRRALPVVWETLARLAPGFTGKVDLSNFGAPDMVESIWISRPTSGTRRPWFRTGTAGYVLPLVPERIAEKLGKTYQCTVPLELLAYVERGELAHANAADEITAVVNRHLAASQFRRVWVYEGLLGRVAMQFSRA